MALRPAGRLLKLRSKLRITKDEWNRLVRVISNHLYYAGNRVGLGGPLKQGGAWDIWLYGFLDGPVLGEAWAG